HLGDRAWGKYSSERRAAAPMCIAVGGEHAVVEQVEHHPALDAQLPWECRFAAAEPRVLATALDFGETQHEKSARLVQDDGMIRPVSQKSAVSVGFELRQGHRRGPHTGRSAWNLRYADLWVHRTSPSSKPIELSAQFSKAGD